MMSVLASGVSHLSFPGGGVFVPTRSAYDRQLLMELVAARAHAMGQVQVLVDNQCWMARRCRGPQAHARAGCGAKVEVACSASTYHATEYCVRCALGAAARRARVPR